MIKIDNYKKNSKNKKNSGLKGTFKGKVGNINCYLNTCKSLNKFIIFILGSINKLSKFVKSKNY